MYKNNITQVSVNKVPGKKHWGDCSKIAFEKTNKQKQTRKVLEICGLFNCLHKSLSKLSEVTSNDIPESIVERLLSLWSLWIKYFGVMKPLLKHF